MAHPNAAELQKTLEYWQYFAPCLGANVSIYDAKYTDWNSASGYSQLNPRLSLAPEQGFYIYSITKTFTAIVVMQLFKKALIQLNDPINKYLSETVCPGIRLPDSIHIKHLLNHTSGIPNYTDLPAYVPATKHQSEKSWSFDKVIDLTCRGELDFEPGEGWQYSNTGYMLLLLMIEAVTKQSFASVIDEYIVQKIGLKNTYVAERVAEKVANKSSEKTAQVTSLTHGYSRDLSADASMQNITDVYDPWWCKTGLIVSTTQEVNQLYAALFNGQLVNKNSLALMMEATSTLHDASPHFNKPSYGFGLMIDPEAEHGGSYGHGGNGPGFNTWTVYYPDFYGRPIIISIFCNTSMGGHPLYLVKDFLRVLAEN
ncbi:serine hydrolase domain-containing protein [sulfur-oxidizing endosymbiont of Gigantopelta aegis]|uniref:serine hydrolase domain-containing protein n=1 Tax=sulfur-oxidizing endosymbiont of Gigantopelta aegis TaxID=2794934 RepID=UPI0018DE5ABF|nr:serine hydrolase [sulfur-oxidizing endosymbiont of Gigantopelta aegis]